MNASLENLLSRTKIISLKANDSAAPGLSTPDACLALSTLYVELLEHEQLNTY